MQKFVLTTAAALALSTGAALAASPDPTASPIVAPAIQGPAAVSAYSGYYSGYVYPNEGLPSDEQYMARPTAPQAGHGVYSHIYLYPPNEGDDSGNNG
jgi:hypothetical protein